MTSGELFARKKKGLETFVITTWGACLKLNRLHDKVADISDPKAIDAGMAIHINEILLIVKPKTKI